MIDAASIGELGRKRKPFAQVEYERAWAFANEPQITRHYARAVSQVEACGQLNAAELLNSTASDRFIRLMADRRASLMVELIGQARAHGVVLDLAWVNGQLEGLQGREFKGCKLPFAGVLARVQCEAWWRRSLRRAVVRMRESEGVIAHEICGKKKQAYCTTDTLKRRVEQQGRNAEMLARTELENESGDVYTLAQLAAASTSCKTVRRAELMTRLSGCEKWADAMNMRGVFLTLTAPSRFHSTLHSGAVNPVHEAASWCPGAGLLPIDAHRWLCGTWAKARARLHRLGVRYFGFRVAEPHHDACPHWHMMLWCEPGRLDELVSNIRAWWLRDSGDEPGAQKYRFKSKPLTPGGAAAYCAKYIAKNIDDAGAIGAEGHTDEKRSSDVAGVEADGNTARGVGDADSALSGATAGRVEAWAAAWAVRQFQAIGQPPVQVWRELRRVKEQSVQGSTQRVKRAWSAAQREGAKLADWCDYLAAQGGAMTGRDYAVRMAVQLELHEGRYESTEQARPVGVSDIARPGEIVFSDRQKWRPRASSHAAMTGTVTARAGTVKGHAQQGDTVRSGEGSRRVAVHPWSCVNNCTRPPSGVVRRTVLNGRVLGAREPLVTWLDDIKRRSGENERGFGDSEARLDDGARNSGAYRLPDMRHESRHADHG